MNRRLWSGGPFGPSLLASLGRCPAGWSGPDKAKKANEPGATPGGPGPFGPGGPADLAARWDGNAKSVKQFDKDGDGRLNKDERQAAREVLKKERPAGGRGLRPGRPGWPGGPGGRGGFNPGAS